MVVLPALPADLQADIDRVGRLSSVPDVLQLVAQLTGMRFTAVARVTDRHWIACRTYDLAGLGVLPGHQLPIELTFCDKVCRTGEVVAFGCASTDPVYREHPMPRKVGFQSYLSVPIRLPDNTIFGTLCALDALPRPMDAAIVEKVELLAQLVGQQLMVELRAERSAAESRSARAEAGKAGVSARLREEFIGILGHDLRHPLQSLHTVVDMLALDQLAQRNGAALRSMQRSLARMDTLIDMALDFARGNELGWIELDHGNADQLEEALQQVVAETRAAYPSQLLSAQVSITTPVRCDAIRMAQLLGNLTINAVVHGSVDSLIRIRAIGHDGDLLLEVINLDGIAETRLEALRASMMQHALGRPQPGLDLGLHIAAQIARAHGGELRIESVAEGSRFALELPATR